MKYILPKKIIYTSGDVKREENLFIAKPLQIGLNEPLTASVKGKASIIFDFGEELSGGVRLLTYSAKGNRRVRIRFGESVSETLAEIGEKIGCEIKSGTTNTLVKKGLIKCNKDALERVCPCCGHKTKVSTYEIA